MLPNDLAVELLLKMAGWLTDAEAERDAALRACVEMREDKRAAMQDAYRAGAEAMREAAMQAACEVRDGEMSLATAYSRGTRENAAHGHSAIAASHVADAIRALPLPAAPGSGDGLAATDGDGEAAP